MKKILIIVGSILIIVIGTLFAFRMYTMSHSPKEEVALGEDIRIVYCRPFKNDRLIFGGTDSEALVPYGEVWRTGANESTVIETTRKINFGGEDLEPGTYTLWTIPNEDSWEVIVNSETGQWGVNWEGIANRKPENDIISVSAHVVKSKKPFEQFTIVLHPINDAEAEMALMWDQTQVVVPISLSE